MEERKEFIGEKKCRENIKINTMKQELGPEKHGSPML